MIVTEYKDLQVNTTVYNLPGELSKHYRELCNKAENAYQTYTLTKVYSLDKDKVSVKMEHSYYWGDDMPIVNMQYFIDNATITNVSPHAPFEFHGSCNKIAEFFKGGKSSPLPVFTKLDVNGSVSCPLQDKLKEIHEQFK